MDTDDWIPELPETFFKELPVTVKLEEDVMVTHDPEVVTRVGLWMLVSELFGLEED